MGTQDCSGAQPCENGSFPRWQWHYAGLVVALPRRRIPLRMPLNQRQRVPRKLLRPSSRSNKPTLILRGSQCLLPTWHAQPAQKTNGCQACCKVLESSRRRQHAARGVRRGFATSQTGRSRLTRPWGAAGRRPFPRISRQSRIVRFLGFVVRPLPQCFAEP